MAALSFIYLVVFVLFCFVFFLGGGDGAEVKKESAICGFKRMHSPFPKGA